MSEDDYGNTVDAAGSLVGVGAIAGDYNFENDEDWIAFSVTEAGIYNIYREGGGYFVLKDADGNPFSSFDEQGILSVSMEIGSIVYISLTGSSGSYSLRSERAVDDFGNSVQTASALASGILVNGNWDYEFDNDMFSVELVAGITYNFYVEFDNISVSNTDVTLLDMSGIEVVGDDNIYSFTPSESGTYYLDVKKDLESTFSGTDVTGTAYSVLFEQADADDHGENSANATTIDNGEIVNAAIQTIGDEDWFSINVLEGSVYRFNLETDSAEFARLRIVDADGQTISTAFNTYSILDYEAKTTETLYVVVDSSFEETWRYSLGASEVFDDIGDTLTTAQVHEFATETSGELEYDGDKDWFIVDLTKDNIVHFTADFSEAIRSPLSNVNIRNLNGDIVSQDGIWEVSDTGQYIVEVSATSAGQASYVLSSGIFSDDHGDTLNDATDIDFDFSTTVSVSGNLYSETDDDVFMIMLEAGSPYNFYADIINKEDLMSPDDVAFIFIRDSDGNTLADSSYNLSFPFAVIDTGQFSFIPDETGQYFVTLRTGYWLNPPSNGADFEIRVETIIAERDGQSDVPTDINEGVGVTGYIDFAGDVDSFKIDLNEGQSYFIPGDNLGLLNRIKFSIFDDSGTLLVEELTGDFTPENSGTYIIEATYDLGSDFISGPRTDETYFDVEYEFFIWNAGNYFEGTFASDTITGTENADLIEGAFGEDSLFGGGGADHLLGEEGNDQLAGGESLELSSIGAQVYRIYQATLDRAPDAAGLADWVSQIESGARSLLQVIEGFTGSAEFQSVYGALEDAAFVELLYNNVLGRPSDAAGRQGWLDFINDGGTRAEVVRGFSESTEFINGTDIAAQVWATFNQFGAIEGQIYRLYQATLNRAPDVDGFHGWIEIIEGGTSLLDIIPGFVNSAEFQSVYGSLEDEAFVELLYNNVLSRSSDAPGLRAWLDFMDGGGTRAEVVRGFSESAEFINGSAGALADFMQTVNTSWNDTLIGGADDDILFGGRGADRFIFDADEDGADTVYGLEAWDIIEMNGFGYTSADDFGGHLRQNGSDVLFSDQGVTITFTNTDVTTVTSALDTNALPSPDNSKLKNSELINANTMDDVFEEAEIDQFQDLIASETYLPELAMTEGTLILRSSEDTFEAW